MADQDVTDLTYYAGTDISADDLLYGVQDPGGTPLDRALPVGAVSPWRYKLTATEVTNSLVVAVKHLDGTDPSSLKPLCFRIGDTWSVLTAALSVTKAAGTNWSNAGSTELAAKDVDYFVYLILETGAAAGLKIGFSRIPYAVTMADFSSTSTNAKYIAGNYTNNNSTDTVMVIGRVRARLSAGAGYTWSIPSAKVVSYPIYDTDWLTWQPVYSAGGSMTFTSVTTDKAEYQIRYNSCQFEIRAYGTTGGSAANALVITPPFAPTNASGGHPFAAYVQDGSNYAAIATIGSTLVFYRYDSANYGLGANRYVVGNGQYRI
jgi:hypothetical protein